MGQQQRPGGLRGRLRLRSPSWRPAWWGSTTRGRRHCSSNVAWRSWQRGERIGFSKPLPRGSCGCVHLPSGHLPRRVRFHNSGTLGDHSAGGKPFRSGERSCNRGRGFDNPLGWYSPPSPRFLHWRTPGLGQTCNPLPCASPQVLALWALPRASGPGRTRAELCRQRRGGVLDPFRHRQAYPSGRRG